MQLRAGWAVLASSFMMKAHLCQTISQIGLGDGTVNGIALNTVMASVVGSAPPPAPGVEMWEWGQRAGPLELGFSAAPWPQRPR